jgi:hypothetical protein
MGDCPEGLVNPETLEGVQVAKIRAARDLTERLGPLRLPYKSLGIRLDLCAYSVALRTATNIWGTPHNVD